MFIVFLTIVFTTFVAYLVTRMTGLPFPHPGCGRGGSVARDNSERWVERGLPQLQTLFPGNTPPQRSRHIVLYTVTNAAYLETTLNWVAHLIALNVSNYVVVADDTKSYRYLYRNGYRVLPRSAFVVENPQLAGKLALYGGKEFASISCRRAAYMARFLRSGYQAIYADSDTVFFTDPSKLLSESAANGLLVRDYGECSDVQLTRRRFCTCFVALKPLIANIGLVEAWSEQCVQHAENDDQVRTKRRLDLVVLVYICGGFTLNVILCVCSVHQ